MRMQSESSEKKRMNILVTGANGQLGTALRALSRTSGDRWIFTDVRQAPGVETIYLDAADCTAVRLVCASEKIDVIINCVAYTDVEKAEEDQLTADLLNRAVPACLAGVAQESGVFLIHISTDYVFRGDRPVPYTEEAVVGPTGVYGATKLAGERAVLTSGCRFLLFRTAWLYSPWGRNFVRTMLGAMASRPCVRVVYDQVGSPTYALDLAELICRIVADRDFDRPGIYHYSGEGAVSWYDFAMAIRELSGLQACEVLPCLTSEYPSKVRRPAYSVLDKAKVRRTFGCRIPHWRESLSRCLQELKADPS